MRRFGERFVVQTKGRWAGKLIVHQPWEVALTNELFLKRPNGERVYKEALIGVARARTGRARWAPNWRCTG